MKRLAVWTLGMGLVSQTVLAQSPALAPMQAPPPVPVAESGKTERFPEHLYPKLTPNHGIASEVQTQDCVGSCRARWSPLQGLRRSVPTQCVEECGTTTACTTDRVTQRAGRPCWDRFKEWICYDPQYERGMPLFRPTPYHAPVISYFAGDCRESRFTVSPRPAVHKKSHCQCATCTQQHAQGHAETHSVATTPAVARVKASAPIGSRVGSWMDRVKPRRADESLPQTVVPAGAEVHQSAGTTPLPAPVTRPYLK